MPGQDTILGEQLNLVDVSSDLATDSTAIGNIATGLSTDPGAKTTFDSNYLRRDGTVTMDGTLTLSGATDLAVGGNIAVTGTVDGRDVAVDGTTLDTHVADATLHFTEASIVHQNISGAGTNTHADIDTHVADATLHFTEISIVHQNISGAGATTHADIDAHIATGTIHFTEASIDHVNILSVGSNTHADIDTHVADATLHFTEASIVHQNISGVGFNTHAQIDTHIATTAIHFTEASIDHANILSIGTNTHGDIDTHISNMANPHGTTLDLLTDVSVAAATSGQVLTYNTSPAGWFAQTPTGGGGGISNIVEDLTPQLGGDLDTNTFDIIGPVGGYATLRGADSSTAAHGGHVVITGGNNTGVSYGGYVNITGGSTTGVGGGSGVYITGGNSTATAGTVYGGPIKMYAGNTSSAAYAGYIKMYAGEAKGSGTGGDITITAGSAVSSSGTRAGDVKIYGGFVGGGTPIPGTVLIRGGIKNGGFHGDVAVNDIKLLTLQPEVDILATTAVDWTTGSNLTAAPSGATTFAFTPPTPQADPAHLTLKLNDGANNVPTWPGTVKWPDGIEPTWSGAAGGSPPNGPDIISFYFDGISYHATSVALNLTAGPGIL